MPDFMGQRNIFKELLLGCLLRWAVAYANSAGTNTFSNPLIEFGHTTDLNGAG